MAASKWGLVWLCGALLATSGDAIASSQQRPLPHRPATQFLSQAPVLVAAPAPAPEPAPAVNSTEPRPFLFSVNVSADWLGHLPEAGFTVMPPNADYQNLHVIRGIDQLGGVAWATMRDNLAVNGWIELNVETSESPTFDNDVKMYAAGFVEGLISTHRISEFHDNFLGNVNNDSMVAELFEDVKAQYEQDLKHLQRHSNFYGSADQMSAPSDPYWRQIRYTLFQLFGIRDGFNFAAAYENRTQLEMVDLFIINSHAEIPELLQIFAARRKAAELAAAAGPFAPVMGTLGLLQRSDKEQAEPAGNSTADNLSERDWERRLIKRGHCSAFVRVTSEEKDLLVGHTTWGDYSQMTRMFKYYKFHLPSSWTAATLIGFSSYPGCVSSTDDFYFMDSGLTVMDTSLEVLDTKIYEEVAAMPPVPDVASFMHVMAVNRIAKTAGQWSDLFIAPRQGRMTGSTQWIVVNYNRFVPREKVGADTVWLVEQLPGVAHKADISKEFAGQGYWASYNRPYFADVRKMSGHAAAEQSHGSLYSFAANPRALIFKKWGPNVEDLFDMRHLMNRNDFPKEGVGIDEPGHAVSARMDLDEGLGRIPNGGIDAKVMSRCMFKSMECQAISGPSHDYQPIFRWIVNETVELFPGWPHAGLPDLWNFNWTQITPVGCLPSLHDPPSTC